jgi:hypothetical protein
MIYYNAEAQRAQRGAEEEKYKCYSSLRSSAVSAPPRCILPFVSFAPFVVEILIDMRGISCYTTG